MTQRCQLSKPGLVQSLQKAGLGHRLRQALQALQLHGAQRHARSRGLQAERVLPLMLCGDL